MQTNARKIYDLLDTEFTRKDVLQKGKQLGIPYSGIDIVIQKLVYHDAIERIAVGRYKKK